MNEKMNIEELRAQLDKMESAFRNAVSTAWDNAPDADPDTYEEFSENMGVYEEEFNGAFEAIKKMLNEGGAA